MEAPKTPQEIIVDLLQSHRAAKKKSQAAATRSAQFAREADRLAEQMNRTVLNAGLPEVVVRTGNKFYAVTPQNKSAIIREVSVIS